MSENQNRPRGRKRNITGQASDIRKQEQVQSSGPVGSAGGYRERQSFQSPAPQASRPRQAVSHQPSRNDRPASQGSFPGNPPSSGQNPFQGSRPSSQGQSPQSASQGTPRRPVIHQSPASGGTRASGSTSGGMSGGKPRGCLPLIVLAVVALLGGGGLLSGLFGGGNDSSLPSTQTVTQTQHTQHTQSTGSSGSVVQQLLGSGSWYSLLSGADSSQTLTGVSGDGSLLNTKVAAGSRDKYTLLKGSGKDKVTILVYMCGADLESRSGMASRDIQEMLSASFGSKINLLLYTGGSTRWKNNQISSRVNQIWQVKDGKLKCLEKDMGTASMTSPNTLLSFLNYGAKNYKANRYQLILWDHGCGSVNGYGYDERNRSSGSMSLAGIDSALKASGLQFDFVGYDACLMATVENALMLSDYADYLIASEESEPGIGWYYTNWLTALGKNSSLSTPEIAKIICDDFTSACRKSCPGQTTTLSLVDLAELSHTVPEKLASFADSVTGLIRNEDYTVVSNARNGSREFASSSRTDMVDLADLAVRVGNEEGAALSKAVKEAVKYNRSSITNAWGLSIFFPYRKISSVDKAVSTYAAIGMDESYSQAIRAFASVEGSGQAVCSQNAYQIPSILSGSSSSWSSGAYGNSDLISSLLSGFLGGESSGSGFGFLSGRQGDASQLSSYISSHMIDPSALVFSGDVLTLSAEQWALVHSVDQNIFYDDGEGYIDLGLDAVYEWTADGNLKADTSGAWLGLNGQIAPYYRLSSSDDGTNWSMTGYIPVLLNGSPARLLVTFDGEHEGGYIAGARFVYTEGETETVAKALTELEKEDEIRLVCDYYSYDGAYQSSHLLGTPLTVGSGLQVTDLLLPDASKAVITYRLTDIYNQPYWTSPLYPSSP